MSRRRWVRFVLSGALMATAATGLATSGGLASGAASAATTAPVVRTAGGLVQGVGGSAGNRFLGIPFATAQRFAAPGPAAPWTGTLAATSAGPGCSQAIPGIGEIPFVGQYIFSEDCLRLNVYVPADASPSHRVPVMVWFYGGAYMLGQDSYDPTPLVTAGDVAVVTVNYRVGPFGFLSLPGASSNNGLRDQQAGLHWVKDNIGAFGGDAGSVTIFGESAGGNSVCQQVASPLAAGLFQRAISESGACSGSPLADSTSAQMTATSQDYARSLGCTDTATMLACLRGLSVAKLESSPTTQFTSLAVTWKPYVDGTVEPRSLDAAWASGQYTHVPMIVGNNHDEGGLFVAVLDHLLHLFPVTTANYEAFLRQFYGSAAPAIEQQYPPAWFGLADKQKTQVITDGFFACPAVRTTAGIAAGGSPVYEYEFADPNPPLSNLDPISPMGDFHASELFYLFDSVNGLPKVPLTAGQQALSSQMIAAWTAFARTGDPGGGWPAWTAAKPLALSLTHLGSHPVSDVPAEHHCDLWAGISG